MFKARGGALTVDGVSFAIQKLVDKCVGWEVATLWEAMVQVCLVGIEVESSTSKSVRAAECVAAGMRSKYRCAAGAHRAAPPYCGMRDPLATRADHSAHYHCHDSYTIPHGITLAVGILYTLTEYTKAGALL